MSDVRRSRIVARRIMRPTVFRAERHREWVRGILAFVLTLLLIIEVGASFYAVLSPALLHDEKTINAVKDILTIVMSPTVALVGAATGFYYGTKI
jgi:hypothetical protein